jgi:hypothetical protein
MSILSSQEYKQAVALLHRTKNSAAVGDPHYEALWVRDWAMWARAVLLLADPELNRSVRDTLRYIAKHMTKTGHVPNTIWKGEGADFAEMGSLDAQCWFIIVAWEYLTHIDDPDFAAEIWPKAKAAHFWLLCQDHAEFGLVGSLKSAYWMDSTWSGEGFVLHNNALYYRATVCVKEFSERMGDPVDADPVGLRQDLQKMFWPDPKNPFKSHHPVGPAAFIKAANLRRKWILFGKRKEREFFVSHIDYGKWVDYCDVLANLLAINFGLAEPWQAERILDYLKGKRVDQPYPSRTFPFTWAKFFDVWGMRNRWANRLQNPRWRNSPDTYHEGAVWFMIGAEHIKANLLVGRIGDAFAQRMALSRGNRERDFSEWEPIWLRPLHRFRRHGQRDQAWSAAGQVAADIALEEALTT